MSTTQGMVRAKDKDGNVVVGWHVRLDDISYIVPEDAHAIYCISIDITTAARATGKLDKNGDMIYGSDGDMQGGDRVRLLGQGGGVPVVWNKGKLLWGFPQGAELGCWHSRQLEIIAPAKEED